MNKKKARFRAVELPGERQPSTVTAQVSIARDEYRAFQSFLEQASGIVLGDGKEYLVSSRLGGLLRERGLSGVREVLKRMQGGDTALRTAVIDAMTTNETFWFRDVSHFRLLTERVLSTGNAAKPAKTSAYCLPDLCGRSVVVQVDNVPCHIERRPDDGFLIDQ